MNVNEGDKAVIVFSVNPANVGRIVNVAEYIGKFKQGEQFEAYGMKSHCFVTDHYWWIEAEDLTIQLGPSPKAYIADSWLRRITPPKDSIKQKESKEIDVNAII